MILGSQELQIPVLVQNQVDMVRCRIGSVLRSWQGTQYREGDQIKGKFVDCVRFVCGVYDELFGWKRALPENLPSDRSLHDREGAIEVMKFLVRLYEPIGWVTDGKVEPGDSVVTGPLGGGPGHALIAGSDLDTLWHVDRYAGVCKTGFGLTDMEVHAILRPKEKHLWLKL